MIQANLSGKRRISRPQTTVAMLNGIDGGFRVN
jgi:hypothetical protein